MTWLWTNIISPVLHVLGEAWQWLTSGSTPAVAVLAAVAAVVVIAIISRRRR
jgi:hypothetical protein